MTFSNLGEQPIKQGFYVLEPLALTGGLELKRFPSQGLTKLTPHLKQPKMTFFHSQSTTKAKMIFSKVGKQPLIIKKVFFVPEPLEPSRGL